MQIVSLNKS